MVPRRNARTNSLYIRGLPSIDMSLITEQIQPQGFEIVRDAIGAILKTELEAQKSMPNSRITEEINIFTGRSTPFQQSEKLMINVLCDSANYSNFQERGVDSGTNYYIDIYCSTKRTDNDEEGYNSTVIRDKFIGLIRYILQDHHYKILGLPLGCIMGTYVQGFENFLPTSEQDSSFVKMSRITFNVRIKESQSVWEGKDINSIFTTVKLELTEKGYKFENS